MHLLYNAAVRTVDGHRTFVCVVHRDTCRYAKGALRLNWRELDEIARRGFDTSIVNKGHRPDRSMWKTGCCCEVDRAAVDESEIVCIHCRWDGTPHDCTACGPVCANCLLPQDRDHHAPRGFQYREHMGPDGQYEDCTANV